MANYGQIYTEWQKFYTAAGSDKYHLWNGQAKLHSFRPNLPVLTSTSRFYKLLPSVINTAEYCPALPPSAHFQWGLNVQWTELSRDAVTAVVRDIIVAVFQQELKWAA